MATIKEELILEDKASNTVDRYMEKLNKADEALQKMGRTAKQSIGNYNQSVNEANTSTSMFTSTLKSLAAAYLGIRGIKTLAGLSDEMTNINARLEMMTGSAESAARAQEAIYAAAERSRGSYSDMADMVAKLGTLAGDAFGSTDEIVAFAEQINKQMALSGTTSAGAAAAMLQLTQAMTSGTLRGEELNSVLENAPMIAQSIAKYMGVSTGEMREMAAQGAITADVVKNAMFFAAEETNAKFESMPMTWGQIWTQFSNAAIRALNPILKAVSWLANNMDILKPIILGTGAAFAIFLTAANWTNICTAATNGLAAAQKALSIVMATAWGPPLIIISLLVGAFYAVIAIINKVAGTSISATGIIAGAFSALGTVIDNIFTAVWNTFATVINFFHSAWVKAISSVKTAFFELAASVIDKIRTMVHAIEDLLNKIPGVNIKITGGIDSFYNKIKTAAEKAKSEADFTDIVKKIDYQSVSDAYNSGYNWGANLFKKSSGGEIGGFTGLGSIPAFDELSAIGNDVSAIKKSVAISEEDIKMLVDSAERRYVNNINLTSQTPVININGQNTGNTEADKRAIANAIAEILVGQMSSSAARTTAF